MGKPRVPARALPKWPRQRNRTFTGCWTCRSRKVKCSEEKPVCSVCQRLGLACGGYGPKLVWVEDDNLPYKSDGRRTMLCGSTWKPYEVLDSELVDFLIDHCDEEASSGYKSSRGFQVSSRTVPVEVNPFTVFRVGDIHTYRPSSGRQTPSSSPSQSRSPLLSLSPSPNNLIYDFDRSAAEKHLFHHYVNHVALLMMPFEHSRNPWRLSYPAVALHRSSPGQRALYNALLAHSAFHLSQLSVNKQPMSVLAVKHYNRTIRLLMESIGHRDSHYAETVAAIMTLLMAETYSGQSRRWRHHLNGAWSLLQQTQTQGLKPWLESDFACFSTQSLYIIRVIDRTATTVSDGLDEPLSSVDCEDIFNRPSTQETSFSSAIRATPGFGFTIGATKSIIEAISKITLAAHQLQRQHAGVSLDVDLMSILSNLRDTERMLETESQDLDILLPMKDGPVQQAHVYHQLKAFIHAAHIYLYRVIFDLPPRNLQWHISQALQHASAFSGSDRLGKTNDNFSLWPAFIAAVEAYSDEDMLLARSWLDYALSFGLGSRLLIKKVVEEVWMRRKDVATDLAADPGVVSVDWREVMRDLDVVVLLI
ncbi:hypothetical protein A1O3_08973 [Capronia epimyces CBS 606.96]|uniref:Zn(2)-C6 fungal-type domain-containing protein n=1 Tax=Capronia epimyces CBS 606.96 TaxID=1182542 RepID=W9Y5U3_9EURO|nr:uncharacterized protein A1O3_08973 [Capronia epimyces CBS 606.96]EXJ77814.1 hypothetical protein A1O3_08973 [Capronia epimyces CBS 606.96]